MVGWELEPAGMRPRSGFVYIKREVRLRMLVFPIFGGTAQVQRTPKECQ